MTGNRNRRIVPGVGLACALGIFASAVGARAAEPGPAREIEVEAVVRAVEAKVVEIRARETLTLQETPVEVGAPVQAGATFARFDKSPLEEELRHRVSTVSPPQPQPLPNDLDGTGGVEGPGGMRPLDAGSYTGAPPSLASVEGRIAHADLRAPHDGYVVELRAAVGSAPRRGDPVVRFVRARETRIELSLAPAEAARFAVGTAVSLRAVDDPALAFDGMVATRADEGTTVRIAIRPSGLPFLRLNEPRRVALTVAPPNAAR